MYQTATQVTTRLVAGVLIVDVAGFLTLNQGQLAFRSIITTYAKHGQKHFLVNLEDLAGLDSAGIQELLDSHAVVTGQGGRIKLLNLDKRVKDLLQISRLYSTFEIHRDEAAAVRSFS